MTLKQPLDSRPQGIQKVLKAWIPLFAGMALIYYLSSCPNMKTQFQGDYLVRRGIHVLEYFLLTFLLFRAFKDSFDLNFFSLFIFPISIALLFAVFDEIHQLYVFGRHGTTRDVAIDMIGIFGFYLYLKLCGGRPFLLTAKSSR